MVTTYLCKFLIYPYDNIDGDWCGLISTVTIPIFYGHKTKQEGIGGKQRGIQLPGRMVAAAFSMNLGSLFRALRSGTFCTATKFQGLFCHHVI